MPKLSWDGKEAVVNYDKRVPIHLLDEIPELAIAGDADKPTHTLIEGDNLLALKALQPQYKGRVKCIYIDPPYNTGNEGWVYNDNVNNPLVKKFTDWVGKEVGKEDLSRHDKWLCFMYPRLVLMRDLLEPINGSIWISIDDHEIHHLKLLMDEIFGKRRFVACNVWQKRYSRENREAIGDVHEYILTYAMNPEAFKENRNLIPLDEESRAVYKNPNSDPKGPWQSISFTAQGFRPNQMYTIEAPNGGKHKPPSGRCWAMIESEYQKKRDAGRMWFGAEGNGVPRQIRYLSEVEGLVPWTWWPHEDVGHTDEAKKELTAILGRADLFDTTPKPVRLLERILHIASNPGDIVLDAFAGSGTTGHAVMKMNAEGNGQRQCILMQLGADQADRPNIAKDITRLRLERISTGYQTGDRLISGLNQPWKYHVIGAQFICPDQPPADIPFARLAPIVYWHATQEVMPAPSRHSAYLGTSSTGTAVILLYNGDMEDKDPTGENALNRGTWKLIKKHVEAARNTVVFCTGIAGVGGLIDRFDLKIEQMPQCLEKIGE